MNLGLVYVILEDNFHCYPCYSRFPDPRSEGKKKINTTFPRLIYC